MSGIGPGNVSVNPENVLTTNNSQKNSLIEIVKASEQYLENNETLISKWTGTSGSQFKEMDELVREKMILIDNAVKGFTLLTDGFVEDTRTHDDNALLNLNVEGEKV